MATIAELRKVAKTLGVPAASIRSATSVAELMSIISDETAHAGNGRKRPAKKSTARKSTTVRKSASSKSKPAVKSQTRGKAQRSTTATTKRSTNQSGRHLLDRVNYRITDGWNAREDSAPDQIVNSLRKHKGDRVKVFNELKSRIGNFVSPTKANGERRTKAEKEDMLRYRIARTDWDFAIKTGQHEKSSNRIEYGSGSSNRTAAKTAQRATGGRRKASAASKASRGTQTATRKRTSVQGRTAVKRGRPKTTATKKRTVAKRGRR